MKEGKAIVIGAGISGLSAALELKDRGFDVTVVEKTGRAGGVIGTFSEHGFKAESGSNSVMVQSKRTLDFLEKLGLGEKIEFPTPAAKKRFFVRYGKVRAVPMSPMSLILTRLFTFFGKIRLFFEPFVSKTPADGDPSVAQFTTRRMGKDILDYALNPFMAGIYGGDPEALSMKHAFPPFWNLEQKYGSVIMGAIKAGRKKPEAGNFFKPVMISFKGGMQTLTDSMASLLGDGLKTSAKILSVDLNNGGWEVSWANDIDSSCERYDALVIAVPAPNLGDLPLSGSLARSLSPLGNVRYAPVATYTMGFKKSDVKHKLDGFGVLTPEREKLDILGSLFISSVFPGRAPEGCVAVTSYIGGMRHPDHADLPREKMRELVGRSLEKLLGIEAEPVFEKMWSWKHAIAQYNVGYQEYIDTVDKVEKEYPNIAVIGSYRGGVGVSSCIESGVAAAGRIASALQN